jgi:hypothetical protein
MGVKGAKTMWDKSKIVELLEKRQDAVERAVKVLFDMQTVDEQVSEHTSQKNGRGFNAYDAKFGSSLVKNTLERGYRLSPTQLSCARRMLRKYAGQLAAIANDKIK